MFKKSLTLFLILFAIILNAQSLTSLRDKITQITASKNAVVGVSIIGNNGKDTLSLNGERHFPMQSVFKFHIGILILTEVDKRKLSLNQKVKIEKHELLPGLWSPLREKYPEGASLTIAEILEYTVSQSDNVGCDVLLRLLGGPSKVEKHFKKNGFKDIAIKINEEVMQNNWDLQFQNWTTPKCASDVLKVYFENSKKLLSKSSHDFIWKVMKETTTGASRLKGALPKGTVVAHKTGWSGAHKETGIIAAVNDIGVVFLPDGKHFIISVFVTDAKENAATCEQIIADISKAAWDHFLVSDK